MHIEVVPTLDTSSCVMGVERFIARRGTPTTIMSDNGTNFVSAQKELLACVDSWKKLAHAVLVQKGIKWKFNPPSAPHHGGSWERLVRSVKRVLYDILGNRRVTEELLRTTLCLVEQSFNTRLITAVSSSPLDLEALTPNHFILGQHAASFASLSFKENFDHKKRFARAQSYANAIWTRWMLEYVPSLKWRAKWHNQSDVKLKAGDLVWVIEPDTPSGHYPFNRRVTEEVLRTTLCLVEQSLNTRPITAVNSNPLDLEALTPNHFILGQHAASFASLSFEENFDHKKRFARAQSYANAIWTRWMREYVPSLNRRAKWHNQSDVKLKAGDLVWVIEPDTPRGHYPFARILRLHYGKDGCARSADIKTVTSELSRPTVKLAPVLPCLGVEDIAAQM